MTTRRAQRGHNLAAPQPVEETPAPDQQRLIRRVLIANRGEIACRIIRTCREMGIATAAVYADPDAGAQHVRLADEAIHLPGEAAAETYLNIPALIAAARRTGSDAIHPGYGFLAERSDFATACRDARIVFIGPTAEVIGRMGSKREARHLAKSLGVPVVPGYDGADQSDAALRAAAAGTGYPLLVKSSAGGGGKGMRVVERQEDLDDALASARREAMAAFGDSTLLLERLVTQPRHVEIQIFGDTHGHLVHLGERECTIQRRHQKLIEETPSPALNPDLRQRMAAAALAIGRALGYTNAGTVEFVLDRHGEFYFLEVNTRLQVEHPVTELVTGLDLVRWQLLVAEGRPLPLAQDEIKPTGHAIEARLYAEDPGAAFLPTAGTLLRWTPPDYSESVRVDSGVQTGDTLSTHYDALLAKISARAETRDEAIRALDHGLARTTTLGVQTNREFLRRVLTHPDHVAAKISTDFITDHDRELLATSEPYLGSEQLSVAAIGAIAVAVVRNIGTAGVGHWRSNPWRPRIEAFETLAVNAENHGHAMTVTLLATSRGQYDATVTMDNAAVSADVGVVNRETTASDETGTAVCTYLIELTLNGRLMRSVACRAGKSDIWWVRVGEAETHIRWRSPLPEPQAGRQGGADTLVAPMPGRVLAVLVAEGQAVRGGDPLAMLEAMKMEHTIRAPHDGIVHNIRHQPGDQVAATEQLLEVTPGGKPPSDPAIARNAWMR